MNERYKPWYLCYAHIDQLAIKKLAIAQGPIQYLPPPRPITPKGDGPGLLKQWMEYYRTVAKGAK